MQPLRSRSVSNTVSSPSELSLNEALWQAAHRGDVPAIRRLIGLGADVDARNADDMNALNIASFRNHSLAYEILVIARQIKRAKVLGNPS